MPALYLLAALIGSLIPVNRGWTEPAQGTTIYLADNGIHADIVMPVEAQGLDWPPLFPQRDFAAADPDARWIAFGAGEERVYLDTPTWWDITPRTFWSALAGGKRVMHVEYVPSPDYAVREIRLAARGISPAVGGDPRRLRARRARPAAADRPSRLRSVRRFLSRDRQGERDHGPATAGSRAAGSRPRRASKTSLVAAFAQGPACGGYSRGD